MRQSGEQFPEGSPRSAPSPQRADVSKLASVNKREQLGSLLLHQGLITPRLDVEPHDRLGVGAAQVEAPLLVFERDAVGAIDVAPLVYCASTRFRTEGISLTLRLISP